MKKSIVKLTDILLNKYIFAAAFFVIWLLFFDRYSMTTQWSLSGTIRSLEKKELQLKHDIEETKRMREDLAQNKELYARQKYWMKKANEQIYLIQD